MNIPIITNQGNAHYFPDFLNQQKMQTLFALFTDVIPWQEEYLRMFGKKVKVPRKIAWHADEGVCYRYSGVDHKPYPWFSELTMLKKAIENICAQDFNGVLLNLYANGDDAMGWHSDNEKVLGEVPTIASLSLGVERKFRFRHILSNEKIDVMLAPGSLLVMSGDLQSYWQHSLPKSKRVTGSRINLSFRKLYN